MIHIVIFECLLYIAFTQEIQYPFSITPKVLNSTTNLFHNYLIGDICLGTPKSCYKLGFSIRTHFIWLCQQETLNKYYNPQMSQTYFNLSQKYIFDKQKNTAFGYKAKEMFHLPNYQEPQEFEFLLAPEKYCEDTEIEGEIGLNAAEFFHGYITNESLLNQMTINNVKYPKVIGIKYNKNNNYTGVIKFKVDDDLINHPKAYTLKTTSLSSQHIMTQLNLMTYNNKTYEANVYTTLHFEMNPIVLPLILYQQFQLEIIPLLKLNDSCYEVKNDTNYFYYLCNNTINTSHFLPFEFTFFDQTKIQIELNDLFLEYGNNGQLLFGLFGNKLLTNQIQLGDVLFRKYYIIFERTNHTITFVPNKIYDQSILNQINNSNSSNKKAKKIQIIQIESIVLSLFSICLLFIIFQIKRRQDNNSYSILNSSRNMS